MRSRSYLPTTMMGDKTQKQDGSEKLIINYQFLITGKSERIPEKKERSRKSKKMVSQRSTQVYLTVTKIRITAMVVENWACSL